MRRFWSSFSSSLIILAFVLEESCFTKIEIFLERRLVNLKNKPSITRITFLTRMLKMCLQLGHRPWSPPSRSHHQKQNHSANWAKDSSCLWFALKHCYTVETIIMTITGEHQIFAHDISQPITASCVEFPGITSSSRSWPAAVSGSFFGWFAGFAHSAGRRRGLCQHDYVTAPHQDGASHDANL